MSKKMATLRRKFPKTYQAGKWTYETREDKVEVMVTVGLYAMVRFKGCMPFVTTLKHLTPAD